MNAGIKLELACKASLQSATTGVSPIIATVASANIYAGIEAPDGGQDEDETTIDLPCVIFSVDSCEPYIHNSPARRCRLRTIIRTQRDDEDHDEHLTRCQDVFGYVRSSDFYAAVLAQTGITPLLRVYRAESQNFTGRVVESVIEEDWDVAPGDIT